MSVIQALMDTPRSNLSIVDRQLVTDLANYTSLI